MLVLAIAVSYKKEEDEPQPQLEVLEEELTPEKTLDASRKYLLKGQYIFWARGVLRIQAGTVIFGDRATKGTLIIDRDGKLFCRRHP